MNFDSQESFEDGISPASPNSPGGEFDTMELNGEKTIERKVII